MDGTGRLFDRFVAVAGPCQVHPYPSETLGYDALVEQVAAALPAEPCVLVAESFSGPVGIQVAARYPERVRGLVLCASFALAPVPVPFAPSALFAVSPPTWAVRALLTGWSAPDDLVGQVREVIASVPADVMAHRLREVDRCDVRKALARVRCPVLSLRARRDRLVGARAGRVLRRQCPDLVEVEIDGPHLLLQRRPLECWDAMRTWAGA